MTPSAEAPKDLADEPEELTHEEEAEPHHAKRVTGQDACEQPKTTISATMRNSNGTQRTLDLHEGFFVNDEFSLCHVFFCTTRLRCTRHTFDRY